jgi:hypothetical protein
MIDQQLRVNPFPNVTLGNWYDDIVMVNWDERYLCEVKRFSNMLLYRFNLGGWIILLSSTHNNTIKDEQLSRVVYRYRTHCYHTVFNEPVTKPQLDSYLAWLCIIVKDTNLTGWYLHQMAKGTYTLRDGFKSKTNAKPPRIVAYSGDFDKKIAEYYSNHQWQLQWMKDESYRNRLSAKYT